MKRKDIIIYDPRMYGIAYLLLKLSLFTLLIDARPLEEKIEEVLYTMGED